MDLFLSDLFAVVLGGYLAWKLATWYERRQKK